jgi:two-component system, cell cycle response regulator
MAAAASPTPSLVWSSAPVMRLWRVVVGLGFGFLVLHLAFGIGGHALDGFAERWVYDGLEVLAATACLLRAAAAREERLAWGVLGVGMLSFALGDICFDFLYGGSPPGVSVCDAFYLLFYPACYAALALLIRARISTFNRGVWLDGAIAALAVSSVSASIVLQVVLDHTHGDVWGMTVGLAYPVADLVLLAMVILVFALSGWRPGRAWAVAGFAFGLITLADSLFLYLNATGRYQEGTLLDALWPATMLLLAVAAWQPVDREHTVELEDRLLSATPLVCGTIALGVLVGTRFHPHNAIADALAAAAIVTVFIRTWLSFMENTRLLDGVRTQSLTDPLTGLGNRRSLMMALDRAFRQTEGERTVFVIYDLNGFKRYNDTFGHPSGDALLERLGGALELAARPEGRAFRLGGDEFCILATGGRSRLEALVEAGADALSEDGDGFHVGAEYGVVVVPDEANDPTSALRLADERLYAQKVSLYHGHEDGYGLLLRALHEREPALREHMHSVAQFSIVVGAKLGLTGQSLEQLRLAAELHDIGKIAVPDAILQKPGALTDDEWRFMRRHTVVGQRILAGSPSLREVAEIVRATHERWDGRGYVDGLSAVAIPLPARIIAVCDAYVAMTSDRPYRPAMSHAEAVDELRRCAGTQFDPEVVVAFSRLYEAVARSLRATESTIRAVG